MPAGPSRLSTAPTGRGRSGRGSGSAPARQASPVISGSITGVGSSSTRSTQPRHLSRSPGSRSISLAIAKPSAATCSQASRPHVHERLSDLPAGTSGSSQSTVIACSSCTDCARPSIAAASDAMREADRTIALQIRTGTGSAAIVALCSSTSPPSSPSATVTVCTAPARASRRPRSAADEPSCGSTADANSRAQGPMPIRSRSLSTRIGRPSLSTSLIGPPAVGRSRRLLEVGRKRYGGADRAEVEVAEPVLGAAGDHLLGELALRVEQRVDPLLEGARADEAVHVDVLALAEAVRAVGRLLLDRRVPPAIEVEDVVRRRQVEAAAAGADRDHERRRPVLPLERCQELRALPGV